MAAEEAETAGGGSSSASASWTPAWSTLLGVSLLLIVAVEAVILEIHTGYFTSGFRGSVLATPLDVIGFFAASTILDAFLVLLIWSPALLVLRWVGLGRLQVFSLVAFAGLVVPLSLDFARYVLSNVLGRITSLTALWELSGRSVVEMAAQALAGLPPSGWLLLLGVVGGVVILLLTGRLEGSLGTRVAALDAPGSRRVAVAALCCAVLGVAILAAPLTAIRFGLLHKPSAILLSEIVWRVTDFDRDGSGLLSQPADPAPFDASIHVYAVDWPGNGIDENQLAGDHPADFELDDVVGVELAELTDPPNVVLILLETFRADLIGQRFGEREITPFLNALAVRGAQSRHAYSNDPETGHARAQLFGGTVAPRSGQTSILSDFDALGYEIAYFSGQNDAFATGEALNQTGLASHFYDARQDRDRHTGRGRSQSALQVSWKLVNQRIEEYLLERRDARPLFLYVNFTDAHFPYHHQELDDILGVDPIDRHSITAERRDQIWATYANSAANVDRAVEKLMLLLEARLPGEEPVVMITGDHGEEFYDTGLLGHGQVLNAPQTRVPLIVSGIGGTWPEPLGLADLRGLLQRNLPTAQERPVPRARFVPDPDRRIFQVLSDVYAPRTIVLRGLDCATGYDFARGVIEREGSGPECAAEHPDKQRAAFERLIRNWEALRLREELADTAAPAAPLIGSRGSD